MKAFAWLAIALGVLLRLVACAAHDDPRGDVVLDVGVARSLAAGEGFAAGFERALARVAGADSPLPRQDLADQHAPLWPLVGAALSVVAGGAFGGLKLASLLSGLLLLVLVWRAADRLTEGLVGAPDGLPHLATAVAATCFVLVDAAGAGSLYAAQAALVLLLVELLAAPRRRVLAAGLCLGALLLLNHQCAVLLPLPLLVLLLGAPPGERGRGAAAGLLAVAVALACQAPWWLRNELAFGNPFHSVNAIYFLSKASVPWTLGVEEGLATVRFEHGLDLDGALRAALGFARPNLLYLLLAGLFTWPVLLGVVSAGWPTLLRDLRATDRRLLGIVLAAAALSAVTLAWPATKLRYLATLAPLVVLLGVRLLVSRPARAERLAALLLLAGWLGLQLATRDDVLGDAPDARQGRWWTLLGGGLVLLVLPALARGRGARAPLPLLAGLPVSIALALAVALLPPRTAYHAAPFLADVFGQPAEVLREADAAAARRARDALVAAGLRRVAGPMELLAFDELALVELPAAGPEVLELCLATLLARDAVDAVVLDAEGQAWLAGDAPDTLAARLLPVAGPAGDAPPPALAVLRVLR